MIGVVLEDQHVAQPLVAVEVEDPLAVRAQHLVNVLERQVGQVLVVRRSLDHHLVRPDPVHLVVEPLAAPFEGAFDLEGRELVRHHPHHPVLPIGRAQRG